MNFGPPLFCLLTTFYLHILLVIGLARLNRHRLNFTRRGKSHALPCFCIGLRFATMSFPILSIPDEPMVAVSHPCRWARIELVHAIFFSYGKDAWVRFLPEVAIDAASSMLRETPNMKLVRHRYWPHVMGIYHEGNFEKNCLPNLR